jgi:hypothetical protein
MIPVRRQRIAPCRRKINLFFSGLIRNRKLFIDPAEPLSNTGAQQSIKPGQE